MEPDRSDHDRGPRLGSRHRPRHATTRTPTLSTELPAPPRYGRASLADLLPSVLAALGVEGFGDVLDLGSLRRVIVLVVDGLGWHNLRAHEDVAPLLSSLPSLRLDAVFPSTTAVALTSIGTGRPPGLHGLVGYASALPGESQPFNLLTWRVGRRGGGRDMREQVVPERYQRRPTAFEQAQAAGVATRVVLAPDFVGSGLTRAALRGGQPVLAGGLEETLRAAAAAADGPVPRLVYAYHGKVDGRGHQHGPGSPPWREALAATDRAVAAAVDDLPAGTRLLLTADHGMIGVEDRDVLELADTPRLMEGVRVLGGEPRMRHLFTHPGRAGEVAERWRTHLGERSTVLRRAEAIEAGLFGPVAGEVRERIGDVLAISRRGTLVHRDIDPSGGRLAGHHGGLDPRELEVPLLTVT